ncbi:NIPSNAP-domain-containing protein [Lentithecium fluviatile CBS 122367]|uniref:NIPSNAP-domain-containing protein n=1 Tax=Lentithecium fluviatile CBS 122367 TaxID=1168545 RepID=A0A6G1INE0_9PLEO|nr:NIPSNAP-domain-containing protein [Lentithecium fluviatile CBS 122367]
MLARRVCASVRNAVPAHHSAAVTSRSFSAIAAAQGPARAPALADVKPDGAAAFSEKQKEFREGLIAAQKKKEQQDSQSYSSGHLSTSGASAGTVMGKSLESLTSAVAGDARAREQDDKKKGGALKTLIYGTPEGRELDHDIERSFSQVLARGKYVHSIVFHEVRPDKVDEYTELVGKWYPKMASLPENKVHLVGSWRTEVGDCDTFVHIWEYQRYEGYHASLHAIQHHPEFPEFDSKLKTLINAKRSSLMQEFSFWPTTPPRQLGGLFELRSYTLHPGNLLEWETHWRRGLKARREVMEGVGAWFVQIGELNTVHHLWQFANLEERKVRREQSWSVEGWGETVHKTVPLIQSMKSRILIPCPWSPVA